MSLDSILQRLPDPLRPSRRFLHFLLIGALNTAVGYGLFVLFLWLGLHYALAAAFATVLGVLFNFKSTGGIVFKSKDNARLPWFVGVYVVVYLINVAGLALLQRTGTPPWLGGLLLILPCAMVSYFLNSRLVFRP